MKRKPDPGVLVERTCLMCNRKFMSEGPGNRRCPKCSALADKFVLSPYDEPSHTGKFVYGLRAKDYE